MEGGIPLETYPGFLRFDAAEDDVEIIYMHRDFDSYINNVRKRTFIPKRELEAFLENAKKYPQFDQRIMEKFVNLPVFQIKELRKNEFPAEEVNVGTCNGDKVNIRGSNTVNSNVITQLSKGDKVQILETGIAGRSDEGQLLIDVPIRDNQGYIIFNARKGQALKIIEKLWNGFKVELLTREGNFYSIIKEEDFEYINNNSWVKVKISSGEIGYCVEDYIDF